MSRYTRANTPLLWIVVPMIIGIIYAESAIDPRWWSNCSSKADISTFWYIFPYVLIVIATLYALIRREWRRPLITLLILAAGAAVDLAQRPEPSDVCSGRRETLVGRVRTVPSTSGRWHRAEVALTHQLDTLNGSWRAMVPRKTLLYVDTSQSIALGETLSFRARSYAIDSSYGDYMGRRGVYSRSYTWRVTTIGADTTPLERVVLLQELLARRLGGASVENGDATAVMQALALGYRTDLDRELRSQYSRVGVAHILAVSGMHVGVIFIVLNLLLGWIRIFRHGQVWMGCCVIAILIIIVVQ